MNIFASYDCPKKSAKFLDDKRVVKMVLESAQLLSTALSCHGVTEAPYKAGWVNHPCSIWARETRDNYIWLYDHFIALCCEYRERFNKVHKCEQYKGIFLEHFTAIPQGHLTPFKNCTPFKEEEDTHKAYRKCLFEKWINDKRAPRWFSKEVDLTAEESFV